MAEHVKDEQFIVTVLIARQIKIKALDEVQAEIEAWKKLAKRTRTDVVGIRAYHKDAFTPLPDAEFLRQMADRASDRRIYAPDRACLDNYLDDQ
jgi:hypothetical protein